MPEHDSTHLLSPTSKALEALLSAPGSSSVEQLSQAER